MSELESGGEREGNGKRVRELEREIMKEREEER